MGGFTAFYMVLGGYKSMAMIDVIFGMIMVVGVIILLGFTLKEGGGLTGITEGLAAVDPRLTGWVGPGGAWPLFCLVFLTSVAPFGMPQLVQKFYAIRDERAIKVGTIASTLLALLICGTAYFCGATTRLFLSPEATPGAFSEGKPVFDRLMPELLAHVVPESLSILILLLVLSASMSTLAALVLISSATVVKDFYAGFARRPPSDRVLTMLMRFGSAAFILISVLLAAMEFETIVAILSVSWGAIGSVFLGPFLWGVFTRWSNKVGAIGSAGRRFGNVYRAVCGWKTVSRGGHHWDDGVTDCKSDLQWDRAGGLPQQGGVLGGEVAGRGCGGADAGVARCSTCESGMFTPDMAVVRYLVPAPGESLYCYSWNTLATGADG